MQHQQPFVTLFSDGESGLAKHKGVTGLERLGTKLKVNAPDQHTSIIDTRIALLRRTMQLAEEECELQRIGTHFNILICEALFSH